MKKYGLMLFLFLFLLSACSKDNSVVAPENNKNAANTYLTEALDIMQKNSINRYKIEWVGFRQNVFNFAPGAKTEKDTYESIKYALKNLGDNHSAFYPPTTSGKIVAPEYPGSFQLLKSFGNSATTLLGKRLTSKIGFIRIPSFSGSGAAIADFAATIQSLIKKVDSSSVKGWIVDLRQNTGGNMWPMLAGIGPILGEGLVGKFIDPDNNVSNWYYEKGSSKNDNYMAVTVPNYYSLINSDPFVAVLTDNLTASSGEAITIAFIKREKTKSFGNYTYGVSTANVGFNLRDGAVLNLTVSTMADRNGTMYGTIIKPDEIIVSPFVNDPSNNDPVVMQAMKWLELNY